MWFRKKVLGRLFQLNPTVPNPQFNTSHHRGSLFGPSSFILERQNILLHHIPSATCIMYLRDYGQLLTKISNVTPSVDQSWATSIGVKKTVTKTSLSSGIVN